jgi:hypothetical protein
MLVTCSGPDHAQTSAAVARNIGEEKLAATLEHFSDEFSAKYSGPKI